MARTHGGNPQATHFFAPHARDSRNGFREVGVGSAVLDQLQNVAWLMPVTFVADEADGGLECFVEFQLFRLSWPRRYASVSRDGSKW